MVDETRIARLEEKVEDLREWRSEQITQSAVRAERDRHLDDRFDRVEKSIKDLSDASSQETKEVKGYLLRVVWLILTGFITGAVAFAMNGGFVGSP